MSFCPHGLPDIESLGADIYLFSLYKVYGPHLGVMYVRRDFADELPHQGHFFNAARAEQRFTAAGADHAQVASVNGVMDYVEAVAGRHLRAYMASRFNWPAGRRSTPMKLT